MKHPIFIFCLILSLLLPSTSQALQLPDLANPVNSTSIDLQDQGMARQYIAAIRQQLPLVHDVLVNEYIKNLGNRLVASCAKPSATFHFFVVNDPTINAFAGPGGYIGVDSGMIIRARTESELAAVLSHEIAHVTQQHIARGLEQAKTRELPLFAAAIAALALSTGNGNVGMGAITGAAALNAQSAISFTRGQEQEADRLGIQTLGRAGYDPTSMARFFGEMERAMGGEDHDQVSNILRDHPVTEARIIDAQNRAAHMNYRRRPESAEFGLIRARLLVASITNSGDLIRRCQLELSKNPSEVTRYTLALALNKNAQYSLAQQTLTELMAQNPNQIIYAITLADIQEILGQASQARTMLAELQPIYPDNYALQLAYAQALIKSGQAKEAVKLLNTYQVDYAEDVPYLALLAKAQWQSGNKISSKQSLAEIYALSGNPQAAIVQLRMALAEPGNTEYTRSVITARMAELKDSIKKK